MNDPLLARQQPIKIRARGDLNIERVGLVPATRWSVKDPLSLRIYQLGEEEYFVLRQLDGHRSLEEIKQLVERRFAPRRMDLRYLHAFVGMLHREGLTVADSFGQGEHLLRRFRERRRGEWLATLANPLAIRFRGINPAGFFDNLYPYFRWCFHRWTIVAAAALIVAAMVLLWSRYEETVQRMPDAHAFTTASNLLWLVVAVAVVKVLHELAHGLTCRHFGGTCHELGVMLLVGIPCLYCNVSDAWMMPGKWRRIAISGAGIFLELTLAAACLFWWWLTETSLLNALCLNLVFVCTVNTLLLNGNPLLRFDGYYVLADYLEIPNLQQQASARLKSWLASVYLGLEDEELDEAITARYRWFLLGYAIASVVYRCVLVAGILWMVQLLLSRYGLAIAGYAVTAVVLAGLLGSIIVGAARSWRNPSWRRRVRRGRALKAVVVTALILATIMLVPLPRSIRAPAVILPHEVRRVNVTVPGSLLWVVPQGTRVQQGEPVARLANPLVDYEIAQLEGQRLQQASHVAVLKRRQLRNVAAVGELPAAEQLLLSLTNRLEERKRYRDQLTLVAPRDGVVLPPRAAPEPTDSDQLPKWEGTPLDSENLGAFLPADTLVCLIADPSRLEANLYVDQAQIQWVREGQAVRLQAFSRPGTVLQGSVAHVSESPSTEIPAELQATGQIPMRREGSRGEPLTTWYQLRVALGDNQPALLTGSTARAEIRVEPQSLANRLIRWLRSNYRFAQ